ncbi:MAG: cysteine--tRNA ligase, partial [Nitriliruptorales bacterium]|nr:cysteine--tRNA ligase [Nitriliruptorales bacterium]
MRLYNTLTRTTEAFVPRDAGRVSIYVCGQTVQDVPHFGHARAAIVPDVLRRYLEWRGHQVFHVRNITDIEDKIIARAKAEDRPAAAVTETFARVSEREMERLGVLQPHIVPRATGHVLEMIALIERLIERGHAYESGGDVFFSVRSFPEYGRLSGRDVDELRVGARVEADERKRDPLDFALWKGAPADEGSLTSPTWPSPWGPGRPGWHIECSAMSTKYLGESFDIHAGGMDLVFPHHENEIAQSEAATGKSFARYWIHNGLLHIGTEKMSKSLGNFITLGEALDRYGADALRMFFLSSSYRSPVDFSEERLAEARAGLDRWGAFLRATAGLDPVPPTAESTEIRERFVAAMEDDLSTPRAQAVLFDAVTAGNQHLEAGDVKAAAALRALLLELAG